MCDVKMFAKTLYNVSTVIHNENYFKYIVTNL